MTAAPISTSSHRQAQKARLLRSVRALLWLAPVLVLVGFFILYPLVQVIVDSFTNRNLFHIRPSEFVGLANYRSAITDDAFWSALRHNLILLISVPISILIGLFVTAILYRGIRGTRLYELLILVPFLPAIAAVSVIFIYVLRPDGPFNQLLTGIGLSRFAIPWRSDTTWAIWAVLGIVTWKRVGFIALLFMARMLSIDRTYFEMASVDGASWVKTMRHIALPQMRSIIQFAAVIGIIEVFSFSFAYIRVLGFRGTGILETYLFGLMFGRLSIAKSSAVAVFLLVIAAAVATYRIRAARHDLER